MNIKNETRRQAIIETVAELCREAVAVRLNDIENAVAEAAGDSENEDGGKPPIAKLTIAIQWPAGADRPQIEAKASYSIRRVLDLSAPSDRKQTTISL